MEDILKHQRGDLLSFGFLSAITTIISVNYWRHAIEGARRTADLVTAKVSFAIYFIAGCIFVRNIPVLIIVVPGCCCIILFFYLSNRYWEKDSWMWVYFHIAFHFFVAFEQFLVVYGIVLAQAEKFLNVSHCS